MAEITACWLSLRAPVLIMVVKDVGKEVKAGEELTFFAIN
jgi:hypothetical protein